MRKSAKINSYADLREHPKLLVLCSMLNKEKSFTDTDKAHAVGHLHMLWWWCACYRPDGSLKGLNNSHIAQASGWNGDCSHFVESLVASKFIDRDAQGCMKIHDWDQSAPVSSKCTLDVNDVKSTPTPHDKLQTAQGRFSFIDDKTVYKKNRVMRALGEAEVSKAHAEAIAIGAVLYLNEKDNRRFSAFTERVYHFALKRVKEGATLEMLKNVVDYKIWDWRQRDRGADSKDMTPYLRPQTLFNGEKFWDYYEQYVTAKARKALKKPIEARMRSEGARDEKINVELKQSVLDEIARRKRELVNKYGSRNYILHIADPIEGYVHLSGGR